MPTPDNKWVQQYTKFGSFEHEIARGNVRGAYPMSTYGQVVTAGTVSQTLVRSQDGTVLNVPAGIQMQVASTDAADAAAGTGVRSIVIVYLNGTLDTSVEVVTLNGTTPVNTVATDIRWVQNIYAATVGSGGKSVGTINVSASGVVYGRMAPSHRAGTNSFFRVPRGKRFYINAIYGGSASGTAATSALMEMVSTEIDGLNQQETGLFYSTAGIALQDNSTTMSLPMPLPVSSGQIVGLIVSTDKGATVAGGLIGWVE